MEENIKAYWWNDGKKKPVTILKIHYNEVAEEFVFLVKCSNGMLMRLCDCGVEGEEGHIQVLKR